MAERRETESHPTKSGAAQLREGQARGWLWRRFSHSPRSPGGGEVHRVGAVGVQIHRQMWALKVEEG